MTDQILLPASTLSGNDVKNAQGESLGHVKDIMLDTAKNTVAYYVLSFGGWLGLGDKLFAIPPEAMQFHTNDKCFILNIDKERPLHNAFKMLQTMFSQLPRSKYVKYISLTGHRKNRFRRP